MVDSRGKGRRRKGETTEEHSGRERPGKNSVRKSLEQTKNREKGKRRISRNSHITLIAHASRKRGIILHLK